MEEKKIEDYADILDMPRPISPKRSRMTNYDRAAQFSPFAALTGYDAVIQETGRLTDARIELGEDGKAMLDEKLRLIRKHLGTRPRVAITCFQPDERKLGGAYVQAEGRVIKIDEYRNVIILDNGEQIPVSCIYDIGCELGQECEE